MQETGTLAEHLFQLFREPLADSSWSDRRLRLPWEIFADLMRRALRLRASPRQHRQAFWRGWRLIALDGTQFSLINTPQITATFAKAVTRRGRAAFAVRPAHSSSRGIEWLAVREIRVRVGRKGHRAHELRLWTSLIDPAAAPALELAHVYASRWEHELYFRELKRQLRRTALLQS